MLPPGCCHVELGTPLKHYFLQMKCLSNTIKLLRYKLFHSLTKRTLQSFNAIGYAWRCWLGDKNSIRPVKKYAPKPLGHGIVDIGMWGTGCSTLWQVHLIVNTSDGAAGFHQVNLENGC